MEDQAWLVLTLREWVENQRFESSPHRAALNAAIDRADIAAVREELQGAPFNPTQRKYLDDLLDRWQQTIDEGTT